MRREQAGADAPDLVVARHRHIRWARPRWRFAPPCGPRVIFWP
jgi:hypothetical protein